MSLLGWFLKVYLFIIVLLFNLQEFLLIKISGIEFLSYFDELVALSAYILGPLILRKKKDLWVLALLLFPLFSILHGIILDGFIWQSGRYIEVIVQSVINFKFFLYFVVFYCFYESSIKAQRSIFDFFCLLILISILGAILNVILPENFVYSTYEYALERKRLIGFQFKPNDLSILFSFLICLALIIKHHKIKIKSLYLTRFVSVVLFVLILLSTARTAIMIVMILVLGTVIFGRNKSYTVIVLILGCILGLLASGKLSQTFVISETFSNFKEFNNINNSQYIRFIMLYYAFIIGSSYLFGVGAGNYGSVMSVDSPVYIEYGLAKISFFENMEGIYDSNIASITGEYGFLGLFLYFALLWKILHYIFDSTQSQLVFLAIGVVIAFTQPFFNYHVNSINFLLLLFSYKYLYTLSTLRRD